MKKTKINKKRSEKGSDKVTEFILMSLKSTVYLICSFLISAAICFFGNIEYEKYFIFLLISLILSSFLSGLSYSRKYKSRGILNGIIAVFPLAVILSCAALIINEGKVSFLLPVSVAIIILSGAVSGTIGVNLRR